MGICPTHSSSHKLPNFLSDSKGNRKKMGKWEQSPIKSMTSCPSQNLPEGLPKKVSPLGEGSRSYAADLPPVSEFESPKLNIAGKLQWPEWLFSSIWLRVLERPIAMKIENPTTRKTKKATASTLLSAIAIGPLHLLPRLTSIEISATNCLRPFVKQVVVFLFHQPLLNLAVVGRY